jgi:hypothetical protein
MQPIFKEKSHYLDFLHIPINLDVGSSNVHCHVFEDPGIDGRIIRWIIRKWDGGHGVD